MQLAQADPLFKFKFKGGLRYVKYGFVNAQSKGLLNLLPTFGAW